MAHTLEIVSGILYSLGDNDYGQLGLGDVKRHDLKEKVITGIDQYDSIPWISSKTGLNHSIAVKKDGSVWFWGSNIEGQMGLPSNIKYLTRPTKMDIPLNPAKSVDINVGLYFTIISQTSEKAYGFGTFQNLKSKIVETYREMVAIYYLDPAGDVFLTIDTGPKTIVGRIADFGYVYSDWSGDLYTTEYAKFNDLRTGDHFTLYSPGNRERLIYKKVDTFQLADGCCKINAVCMHRKYRELQSYVSIVYPTLPGFAVEDLLSTERTRLVQASEQYGTIFTFNSALTGMAIMAAGFPNNIDPVTLKGMYLATGKSNLLDVIMYGGLYFSQNTTDALNVNTIVEKIDAREIFKKDTFPPYFEEISEYTLLPGDPYNPDPLIQYNLYDRSAPLYFFKKNTKGEPIKHITSIKNGYIYTSTVTRMSELDKNIFDLYFHPTYGFFYTRVSPSDPNNPIIVKKETNLPADETNRIIVEDMVFTHPYLIQYDINADKSSFAQNFTDPYLRVKVQDPANGGIACNDPGTGAAPIPTISAEDSKWLYECQFQTSSRVYPTYNIGPYAKQLIEYFLLPETDPEECNKFFGFAKFELEELYTTIKNGDPTAPGYGVVKQSYELLRDILNTQVDKKLYISPTTGQPIYKIDNVGNSENSETISFSLAYRAYTKTGPVDGYHRVRIPFKKISCWTYFQKVAELDNNKIVYTYKPDKYTIVVPFDVTNRIKASSTKISYWLPKVSAKDGSFNKSIDNIVQHTATVNIANVQYDTTTNLTKITLDTPFSIDYIIGCIPQPGPPPFCAPIVGLEIYYNNIFDISQGLQDTTGVL